MVIAYHVCFSTYGFWLPNDPRGSNSWEVRAEHLKPFGPATKVHTRKSVARAAHNYRARLAAKRALWFEPVVLTGVQAQAVGNGFGQYIRKSGLIVRACAILPTHVHLVIMRHRLSIEQVVNLLKGSATRCLRDRKLYPGGGAPDNGEYAQRLWGRGLRKVFINDLQHLDDEIQYVNNNPLKEGKPRQTWGFVTE